MTGLLELYNKKYLKETKQKLNEAEVIDPAKLVKAELDVRLAQPEFANITNEAWNDLFKEYTNKKEPDYSIIKVKDLKLKSEASSKSGYIKYNASSTGTGTETKHKFLFFGKKTNTVDTVESGKIEVVSEAADASIFTESDARAFINAIKRNADFDLGETFLSVQKMDSKVADSVSSLTRITNEYFKRLCKVTDDSAADFIKGGIRVIVNVGRKREAPLVGNPLLDALANAFEVSAIRNNFKVTDLSVTILANLLAKGITSVSRLKKLDTFKSVIVFNNNLYSYSVDQINDLFNLYDKAKNLTAEEIGISEFKGLAGIQIAKHLIMNQGPIDDNDAFAKITLDNLGADTAEDLIKEIVSLGKKVDDNDGNLLKWGIRTPNQAKLLFDKLSEESEDENARDRFYFQRIRGTDLKIIDTEVNEDSEEATVITKKLEEFKEGDRIRLVYTQYANRENVKAPDKFSGHMNLFEKDNLSDKFSTEGGKVTLSKDIKTRFEFKFAVTGSVYELFSIVVKDTESIKPESEEDTEKDSSQPSGEKNLKDKPKEETKTEETLDKTGLEQIEPDGRLEGDILRDVSVEVGDIITGTDGKEYQVKPETVGDGKWDIKVGTKIFRKPVDLNHLSTGKSVGDLLKSRDEFRIEYSKLTPSEKAKIKSIVNPAWLPKA